MISVNAFIRVIFFSYTKFIFRYSFGKTFSKFRNFVFSKDRNSMRECLALRQRKILLRSIFGSCRRSDTRWLVWEETFEDSLGLPFGGVCKVNPYVHTPRTAKSGIKTFNMISGSEQKPFGV